MNLLVEKCKDRKFYFIGFCILIIGIVLSISVSFYAVIIYLVFYLFPLLLSLKYSWQNIDKILLSILIWLAVNVHILLIEDKIVSIENTNYIVAIVNTLIISWVNIFIYSYFSYALWGIIKKKWNERLARFSIIMTMLVNFLTAIFLYERIAISSYVFMLLFAGMYVFLLSRLLTKDFAIYMNFMFSVSSVATVVTGVVIIFFIVRQFINPENGLRMGGALSLTFLNYFQITSLSSCFQYFYPTIERSGNLRLYGFLLFLLMSVGIVFQFLRLNFLIY